MSIGGRIARLGDKARPTDAIAVNGKAVAAGRAPGAPRVIAYHKPEGQLVTSRDPEGRETVFARLPFLRGGRWIAVGRLDLNTSGLLLLTDSGELANRLMHPRQAFLREYAARVRGELSRDQRRRLLAGVRLPDGLARFESVEAMEEGSPGAANRWYRVGLREGRNREVRRLFEAVGLQVSRLIRVRFGPLTLGRDLRRGRWRELGPEEVRALLA